jgi:hypothetical protein
MTDCEYCGLPEGYAHRPSCSRPPRNPFTIEEHGSRFRVMHPDRPGQYVAMTETRESAQAFIDQIPKEDPSRCVYCSVLTSNPVMGAVATFDHHAQPCVNKGRLCAHCAYELPGLIVTSTWRDGR